MKYKYLIIAFYIFFINLLFYGYSPYPGSQYSYLGYGVKELSSGLSGIAELGSIEGNSFNPASLADLRRIANSVSIGGFGGSEIFTVLGFAMPTLSGVYSINAFYQASPNINNLLGIQVNLAKPITENLYWGIGLKGGFGNKNNFYDWNLGLDIGVIGIDNNESIGFGFNNFSYGIVLKNIGKILYLPNTITVNNNIITNDAFPAFGIGAGISFYPVKFDLYKLKLLSDLTIPIYPINLCFNIGIENTIFDLIKLRFGYIFGYSNIIGFTGVGPFTFGLGLSFKLSLMEEDIKAGKMITTSSGKSASYTTDIDLSYSLQQQDFNGVPEIAHFIGVNVAWGYYDDQKPNLTIIPDFNYISPNFDNIQDKVTFKISIKDNQLVEGWELNIYDLNNNLVKQYKSIEKLQIKNLTIEKFISQIFSIKSQVEIPSEIIWNGDDNKGEKLPDGEYFYVLRAWDENKNIAESSKERIIIDTVVPYVKTKVDYLIFSPNNDGVKDDITFYFVSSNIQKGDRININIRDSKNAIVKNYNFEDQLPDKIIWDGKDNSSVPVNEGDYRFEISIVDFAGNRAYDEINKITLVTNYQTVVVDANYDAFSPNNDGIKDNVIFKFKVSDLKGLERWEFNIYDSKNVIVKSFKGTTLLPDEILWNGVGDNNIVLPDGIYIYNLQLYYDSGNFPKSQNYRIEIDNTPVKIKVIPEYKSFSPNDDGKQDTLTFQQEFIGEDNDSIESKIVDQSGNIVYYNSFILKEAPSSFTWNGKDTELKPLPEGKYSYIIEATDKVGNKSSFTISDILLKTGLEKVGVQADISHLSPNNDGLNDSLTFFNTVTREDGIISFVLEIKSTNDNLVVKDFNYNKYVDKIVWDGRDNNNKVLKDGIYSYQLKLKYDFGDEPLSTPKLLKIDTVAPKISIKASDNIFSPNKDGRKETITFNLEAKGEDDDIYKLIIINKNNNIIKNYEWKGNVPSAIVWDGNDNSGKPVESGLYDVIFIGYDRALNSSTNRIQNIKLVREFETLLLTSDITSFSPNGDNYLDSITFRANISSEVDLIRKYLLIMDNSGNIYRTFENPKENIIVWDGRNDKGEFINEGLFNAMMILEYSSGNIIHSTISNIILDRNPPSYKLNVTPELFTPDDDGENDKLFIHLELNDFTSVADWEIGIYKKEDFINRKFSKFKTFKGTGNIKTILEWDGYNDSREDMVESVQDYILLLTATDILSNRLTNITKEINVGVLVERVPDGLRIKVSSIKFDTGKANLIGDSKEIINKVLFIVRKILSDKNKYGITDKYTIEIGGFTDDVDTEEFNMRLSERRAKAVYDVLIQNDIDPKILTYKGYGETRLYKGLTEAEMRALPPEKREEYRARSRRVEFFIRK